MSWEEIEECGDRVIKCPHCGYEDEETENFCHLIDKALDNNNYEDNIEEYECYSCEKTFHVNLEVKFVFSTGTVEDEKHPAWCPTCGRVTYRYSSEDTKCRCGVKFPNNWGGEQNG